MLIRRPYAKSTIVIGAALLALLIAVGLWGFIHSGSNSAVERIESQQQRSIELNSRSQERVKELTDSQREAAERINRLADYQRQSEETVNRAEHALDRAEQATQRNAAIFEEVEKRQHP